MSIGEFSIAETPVGDSLPAIVSPPAPGGFPAVALGKEFTKVRFLEDNAADGINRRWYGMPRGVWLGFSPSVTPGSEILTLETDPDHGFSMLRVGSETAITQIDIFTNENLTLDFTSHTQYPVYVIARADWVDRTATQAKILTRVAAPSGPRETLICQVDRVGGNLTVSAVEPDTKQPPTAFVGQTFGFMPGGSIEDLSNSSSTVAEVIAARTSAYTGLHADLKTRIDADLAGEAMADRLALRMTGVISNVATGVTGSSINVSGSFTETGREIAPILTIEPGGDEVNEGVVTAAPRNVAFIVDASDGTRLVNPLTNEPVYGQLSFSLGTAGIGREIVFTNASTTVTGNGSNPFQPPLEQGDIVLAPDGLFYAIKTFIDPDNAVLESAYRGGDASVFDTNFRRFTLDLFTVAGGSHTIIVPTSIQFTSPCFFRTDRAIFDGFLLIKKNGERAPIPDATEAISGKALLATAGGKVGAFRTIKDVGVAIGVDYHTLNFVYGGATDAGGGVVDVAVTGATGPAGPAANQGPTGPSGPAGAGYSTNNPFEVSAWSTVPVPTTLSHTVDFSAQSPPITTDIKMLYGGFAGFQTPITARPMRVTNIQKTGPTTGLITGTITGPAANNTQIKVYLGASE